MAKKGKKKGAGKGGKAGAPAKSGREDGANEAVAHALEETHDRGNHSGVRALAAQVEAGPYDDATKALAQRVRALVELDKVSLGIGIGATCAALLAALLTLTSAS